MQHELAPASISGALLSVSRCWFVASQFSAKAEPGGAVCEQHAAKPGALQRTQQMPTRRTVRDIGQHSPG